MQKTNDIDANGYWTIDNYSALMGLAAYRWLAEQVGNTAEANWAAGQYASLLAATTRTLNATISASHLTYLPCSMTEPNTSNRCANAEDANWAAPFLFGRWAWDGYLFGAPLSGPGLAGPVPAARVRRQHRPDQRGHGRREDRHGHRDAVRPRRDGPAGPPGQLTPIAPI